MIQPRVQIVVNPRSGNGRALATARRLESELAAGGREVRTFVVKELAEASQWAKVCRGEFSYLVCVGGDSTLSEIAPAALKLSVPLVPVPVGFGNIFARAFGHHARRRDFSRMLEDGEVHRVDVGIAQEGVFLSSRSFGFLEQVKQTVEAQAHLPAIPLLRYLSYVRTAAGILPGTPMPSIQVEVDGEPIADATPLAIVANVPTYRGFLNLTPRATPFDGLLDVFVFPRRSKLGLVAHLLSFLLHLPGRWRGVLCRRGRRVSLVSDGAHREELRVLPRSLPVLTPAGWATCGFAPAAMVAEGETRDPHSGPPVRAALEGALVNE